MSLSKSLTRLGQMQRRREEITAFVQYYSTTRSTNISNRRFDELQDKKNESYQKYRQKSSWIPLASVAAAAVIGSFVFIMQDNRIETILRENSFFRNFILNSSPTTVFAKEIQESVETPKPVSRTC